MTTTNLQRTLRRPWSRLDGIARTEARRRELREECARELAIREQAEAAAWTYVPVKEDPDTGSMRIGQPPPPVLRIVVRGRQLRRTYGPTSWSSHTVALRSVLMRLDVHGGGRIEWWSWELAS